MQQPASAWTAVQGAYTASIQTGEKTQKNKKPETCILDSSVLSDVLCACFVEKYILVTCAPFEGSTDPI